MSERDLPRVESSISIAVLCREFEAAWRADKRPDIAVFLARVEDEAKERLLARLVVLDAAQRRRFGDTPLTTQYQARFPRYARVIEEALAAEDTEPKSLAVTAGYLPPPPRLTSTSGEKSAKERTYLTLDQFVQSLTDCGLMSHGEVDAFLEAQPAASRPVNGKELAEALYRQKKLTRFQVQAVYQGKTRGLVVGNYVVLDQLGKGGMGQVYKARHRVMERVVALKVLPSQSTKSEESVRRFHREVKAAAMLSHPNIVTAYDADEAKGIHFLVMEYVEGQDLGAMVKDRGPLPVRQAADCILQAARGLEYAHENGVVHRDIKPHNLLLDRQGTVKVLDMGLARIEQEIGNAAVASGDDLARSGPDDDGSCDNGLTQHGQVMGTLGYMSPEQTFDTKTADARADIYSLGCTLHHLLISRPPYSGNTATKRILAHRNDPIPSLRARRADVPESLDLLFQKMLAKRAEDRQQTATQLIADLEGCLAEDSFDVSVEPDAKTVSLTQAQTSTVEEESEFLPLDESFMSESVEFSERLLASRSAMPPPVQRPRWAEEYRTLLVGLGVVGVFSLLALVVVIVSQGASEGTLVVEVDEPGATIEVLDAEGRVVVTGVSGDSPFVLSLKPGKHQIRVEKDGFEFFTQDVELEGHDRISISARLEKTRPPSGTLLVKGVPSKAVVEILDTQGKIEATYQTTGSELSVPVEACDFRVRIEHDGSQVLLKDTSVAANQTVEIDATSAFQVVRQQAVTEQPTSSANAATNASVSSVLPPVNPVEEQYTIVPPDLTQAAWKKELAVCQDLVNYERERHPEFGPNGRPMLVFRIFGEEPVLPPAVFGIRSKGNLLFNLTKSSYHGSRTAQQGEFVRTRLSRSQAGPAYEEIPATFQFAAMHHYAPEITLKFRIGEIVAVGDVILRKLPESRKGQICVRVSAEDDASFSGGTVLLKHPDAYEMMSIPLSKEVDDNGHPVWKSPVIASRDYELAVSPSEDWINLHQKVTVVAGQSVEANLSVYRQRLLTVRWWYREGESGPWRAGILHTRTGQSFNTREMWGSHRGGVPAFSFYFLDGLAFRLVSSDFRIARIEKFTDPEDVVFPSADRRGEHAFDMRVGDAVALLRAPIGGKIERALIRIEQITPVGVEGE